jgi:hypothetical protein
VRRRGESRANREGSGTVSNRGENDSDEVDGAEVAVGDASVTDVVSARARVESS